MPNIDMTCVTCGGPFSVRKVYADYQRRRGKAPRFCSMKCVGASRVKAHSQDLIFQHSIPEPMSGCWLWTGPTFARNYGKIGCPPALAHRISWTVFRGAIPAGLVVRHRCDNPSCVNPDHLELGTNADNVADKIARGRQAKGERIARAVLSAREVGEIKLLLRRGAPRKAIAHDFSVSVSAVNHIAHGRSWKHLTPEPGREA